MSNGSGLKEQIRAEIARTEDHSTKVTLLLLMQVLEDIGSKIDTVLADENKLRSAVLNGHAADHNADHDWVRNKRREEEDTEKARLASRRKIIDGLIEKALWVILGGIVSAGIEWEWFFK